LFPISRDPPEGGTVTGVNPETFCHEFPISRDPPEGGTFRGGELPIPPHYGFQFLGIPPKGEQLFKDDFS